MKRLTIIGLMLLIPLVSQAGCRVPKAVTFCHRQCCYNYWGPGVHCTETCSTKKIHTTDSQKGCSAI